MTPAAGARTFSDPPAPAPAPPRFVAGLDLGKQSDPSALALLRWTPPPGPASQVKPLFTVPTLQRWPLGTPYTDICGSVVRFMRSAPLLGTRPLLVVDATGVGAAVCEMVHERLLAARVEGGMVQVTITAGSAVTLHAPGLWHVAKKQLVSVLQVLLGERRLRVPAELEQAAVLVRELETFSVKITAAANESFEAWRERDHDDLVLALALACWAAVTVSWPPAPDGGGVRLVT